MIPRGQRNVRVGELVRINTNGPKGLVVDVQRDSCGIIKWIEVLVDGVVRKRYIDDLPMTVRETLLWGAKQQAS